MRLPQWFIVNEQGVNSNYIVSQKKFPPLNSL